jgi:hypothetical protein
MPNPICIPTSSPPNWIPAKIILKIKEIRKMKIKSETKILTTFTSVRGGSLKVKTGAKIRAKTKEIIIFNLVGKKVTLKRGKRRKRRRVL